MKLASALAVPPGVVTAMTAGPAFPGGATALMDVFGLSRAAISTLLAGTPPKLTVVAVFKLLPWITTAVPPKVEPLVGENAVILGAGIVGAGTMGSA